MPTTLETLDGPSHLQSHASTSFSENLMPSSRIRLVKLARIVPS
jgi:hypothetical protein